MWLYVKTQDEKWFRSKRGGESWLCLHNNHIEGENEGDERLEILFDKVAVESFEVGAGVMGKL